jgi:aldose 1-epimerase
MRLRAGDAELILAPEMGGAVAAWTVGGLPIFRAENPVADGARAHACYPLFPFSNRVANRRFTWDGQTYELPALIENWAIHGSAWKCAWQGAGNAMTLDYQPGELWPFAFFAEQIFDLTPTSLGITLRITNRHTAPAPCAFGEHPFFWRSASTRLHLPVSTMWQAGPDKIPTGKVAVPPAFDFNVERELGDVEIDHCFSGWDGTAHIVWPDRGMALRLTASEPLRHVVFYTPPGRPFFAVEPVSNRNDGLNHMHDTGDHGMKVLAVGESMQARIDMVLETLTP